MSRPTKYWKIVDNQLNPNLSSHVFYAQANASLLQLFHSFHLKRHSFLAFHHKINIIRFL